MKYKYCDRCAGDNYLPKNFSKDYGNCIICGGYKPCNVSTDAQIRDYKENMFSDKYGRRVA